MDDLGAAGANQRRADLDQLTLLSTLHFVGAGLAVLGILMLCGHYAMFSKIMSDPKMWPAQGAPPPPPGLFDMMKWSYLAFAVILVGSGLLNVLAGLSIRARKHRLFALVVAVLNCFYMPLGTALGVFTIVVLVRASVRELFDAPKGMLRE